MFHYLRLMFFLCLSISLIQSSWAKPVSVHKTNFFMLEYKQELLYPIGVNTNSLLNLDEKPTTIQSQIKRISSAGANTLRLSIDQSSQNGKPITENRDGTLQQELLQRIELICLEAEKHNAIVVVSMLDLQHMAETWKTHPYNQINGGECDDLQHFFTNPQRRNRCLNRIKQIIQKLQSQENVIFELARGINLDEWKSFGDEEWRKHIHQWTTIMLDTIQRGDHNNHLIALSYLPNTTPYDMMNMSLVDISFLHIKANNAIKAVQSSHQLINLAKKNRRPVFIGELTWSSDANQSIHYQQMMQWSLLAAGTSTFLHNGNEPVPSAVLELVKHFRFAMPIFDLTGAPRPPAKPKPELFPPDSYVLIEHITGYDWIFCIIRKTQGNEATQIKFPIQTGWYEYQWFHIENTQILPNQRRHNSKGLLHLQSPEMEQIIIGRLRYLPELKPILQETENQAEDLKMKEK